MHSRNIHRYEPTPGSCVSVFLFGSLFIAASAVGQENPPSEVAVKAKQLAVEKSQAAGSVSRLGASARARSRNPRTK